MKILLIGEYNRTHQSLKEGLMVLGHTAIVVALSDGFKKTTSDIEITNLFKQGIKKKLRTFVFKIFNIDLYSQDVLKQIKKIKPLISEFDVVQFVNESSFICTPKVEIEIFNLITKWNEKAFLLSCGTDYPSVKYAFDKKFRYSILTPYFNHKVKKSDFSLGLKYLEPEFIKLHQYIYKRIAGVISCDLDYAIPLKINQKHLGLIPHAINTDKINYIPLSIKTPIVIFHGINRTNYYKKGNDIFEEALAIIKDKYSTKIKIITVENVPYSKYIKAFDDAHILLDQVFAYDQGYNALEAMAKGKVVFTGAEQEWLDHYGLDEDSVAVNALPDKNAIAQKLEWLILNPEELIKISKNARDFVKREHGHIICAERFLNTWKNA